MKASAPATRPADPGQTGKSGFMPLFSFFSGRRPGPRQGLCPWTPRGAACPLPQFAKVVARRRQGGFLQLPCSLGFRLASSATGGARLRPPPAFEKSGRKPGGKLLLISNGLCQPAAHRERRTRFAGREPGRAGGGLFASPAEIPAAPGGAAAFMGRGLWPRPMNMPAAGLARQRAGGLRPPAAPPGRWNFHQRQKGNAKARPHALWGLAA